MHHDGIRQRTRYGKLIVTFVLTLKNVNILHLKRYPLRREATWTSNSYEKSMESGTWAILVSCTLPPTEVSTPSMAPIRLIMATTIIWFSIQYVKFVGGGHFRLKKSY